jgi:hypothetical protein
MTMVVFVCFVNDTKGVSQQANVCRSGETCSSARSEQSAVPKLKIQKHLRKIQRQPDLATLDSGVDFIEAGFT